ncbi:hypothetical protein APR41_04370 [Salegentibacter salinarum]|uniref:Uncharacterized protein n=1 Tax=Salegentibacter salinarum TaxID=447422 RepID=A0A2N0TUJ4_9FLAO|nr:AAA family ATPase [Salegentibacter salinarum]PKD18391.1 hypothetical protein APR41_04370 [Salegentibacter salinarum]
MMHNETDVQWHIIYKRLATLLFDFANANSQGVGFELFKILTKNARFKELNPWISNLYSESFKSFDPIQVFASFNGSRMKDETRLQRINILFSILEDKTDFQEFKNIDFKGCPAPLSIKLISPRTHKDQREIWELFRGIFENSSKSLRASTFNDVKNWYGVDVVSLTQFLFWIDSDSYLPLDKNTVQFLKKLNKIDSLPDNVEEYNDLIVQGKPGLFREITELAYERKLERIHFSTNSKAFQEFFIENFKYENSQDLQSFKFIGIRPLKEMPSSLKKVLLEDHLYIFYNHYQFSNEDKKVVYDNRYENIYNIKDGPIINISAMVGKNGVGKSSLTELLYMSIYNLSIAKGLISNQFIEDLHIELFFRTDTLYKLTVNGEKISIYSYSHVEGGFQNPEKKNLDDFHLNRFFYTIAVNYSHYGLNSKKYKLDWITPLSHKNDGYQSPVVINPMRTEGNINVNREESLLNARMLANILEPVEEGAEETLRTIYGHKKATHLIISENEKKGDPKKGEELNYTTIERRTRNEIIRELYSVFQLETQHELKYKVLAEKYFVKKLFSVCHTYSKYHTHLPQKKSGNLTLEDVRGLLKKIKADQSHMVFKLKQTINYLKYGHIDAFVTGDKIALEDLSAEINRIKSKDQDVQTILLIPPPIFNCKILLEDGSDFAKISSGESQLISIASTVAYHLNNLDSVQDETGFYRYGNILVMMDEAELYFHPDLQRRFIQFLLDYLSKIDLSRIEGINFCFITHSPFLLSDIIRSNVLPMGDESSKLDLKTFGANVYDILANSFFFNDGFVGELAKRRIKEVVDWINGKKKLPEYVDAEYCKKIIQLIDEPIVQKKLAEMYDKKVNGNVREKILHRQIQELQAELAYIKK